MNGDYTKVPLRANERWTGARMQQGRVLLDHEWNLNLDATTRAQELAAFDAIGGAGVRRGTSGFNVTVPASGALDLQIEPGRMWVGGHVALAPTGFSYSSQPGAPPLPAGGRVIVYLDVFEEHLQPAESPAELVEPALAPVQSAARTRVGYRVRMEPSSAPTARDAWAAVRDTLAPDSAATLTIAKAAQVSSSDPCSPPGDPGSEVPEGLFRVEVLDGGSESTARFAWAFDNGCTSAQVLNTPTSAADVLVESAPGIGFAKDDFVEFSWLERRADRKPHGELYKVLNLTPKTQGISLELGRGDAFVAPPSGAHGLVVRRWDGQAKGAGAPHTAKYRTREVARITPGAGTYLAGDWWGARLRDGSAGLEERTAARPDGTPHSFAPLAFVDLSARTVEDLRPQFRPLVETDSGTCTLTLNPGSDLQRAIDKLPAGGAEICFQAGTYLLDRPLRLSGKRLTLHGAGPATVLAAGSSECALMFEECTEVEVRAMRIEGGPTSSAQLDGALTFLSCVGVRVTDCVIACADAASPAHSCLSVRSKSGATLAPDAVVVEGNTFEVGAQQIGVLLVDVDHLRVTGNRLLLAAGANRGNVPPFARQGFVVGGARASVVQVDDNQLASVAQGVHVGLSDTSGAALRAGRVQVRGNSIDLTVPLDYALDRHAIFVATSDSIQVLENCARIQRIGQGTRTPVTGIVIKAPQGPMMVVRDTSLDGFEVGVAVIDVTDAKTPADGRRVWLVEGTMAANGALALDAPAKVDEEHNAPMPAGGKLKIVTVTPAAAGTGTTAQGTVTLDVPAGRAGATIKLSSDNAAATVSPQSVTIAPGTTTASFTVTTTGQALVADQAVKIQAELDGTTVGFNFTVIGKAAVKSLGLAPTDLTGGAGAKSQGTVSLTKADPNAVVALTSSNPSVARPVSPTVQVPAAGTSANFEVQTSPVSADQSIAITADFNGSQRAAALTVRAEPLLKIARIRILVARSDTGQPAATDIWFDSQAPGGGFFPSRTVSWDLSDYFDGMEVPNAIEVEFAGGPLNLASIDVGVNFTVAHPTDSALLATLPQPMNQRKAVINASTVRWVANPLPVLKPETTVSRTTTYNVRLLGDGNVPISSQRGRRLDGGLINSFPSGDGSEGGDAAFTLRLKTIREPIDREEFNDHIDRAHPDDP